MVKVPLLEDKLAATLNDVYENVSDYVAKDFRDIPIETGVVILYNADAFVLRAFFHAFLRHRFEASTIQLRNATFEDTPYKSSEFHMEFELCDVMIKFIKQITKNTPINNHAFMFCLLNFQDASKPLQQGLRRLLDSCARNSVFVLAVTCLSRIDQGILSRASIVNLYKMKKPLWDASHVLAVDMKIKGFLENAHKLKPLDKMLKSRELAYQLYHINYPIERMCHAIISFFIPATDESIILKAVDLCTKADVQSRFLHKDIFCYEQLMLQCVKLREGMKISRRASPQILKLSDPPTTTTSQPTPSVPPLPQKPTKTKLSIKLKDLKVT